jgi:uncharacterized protein
LIDRRDRWSRLYQGNALQSARLKSRISISIITLVLFLGTVVLVRGRSFSETYASLRRRIHDALGVDIMQYDSWALFVIVAIAGAAIACGWKLRRIVSELGLDRPIVPALLFALLASLPMLSGYGVFGRVHFSMSLIGIALIFPFIEELFFRGWAFRQLCQRAKWGFWPAGLLTGVVFGLMHIPVRTIIELNVGMNEVFTVLLTGAGGVFFAWLYIKWQWNLWVPILLHMMMNAWWEIFATADGAVGGLHANICRGMTIAAAILLTTYRERIPGWRSKQTD